MSEPLSYKWHRRYLALAKHISEWSKDPSTKVGSVIVDDHNTILGTGYNGFARGVEDSAERYADREGFKYPCVVHAEVNAILQSTQDLRGSTIYCSICVICARCASCIIQKGITTVVTPDRGPNPSPALVAEGELAKLQFREAGVRILRVQE